MARLSALHAELAAVYQAVTAACVCAWAAWPEGAGYGCDGPSATICGRTRVLSVNAIKRTSEANDGWA